MSNINLIVAFDSKKGISKNNKIPWEIKEDYNFFQDITSRPNSENKKNVLIMGKNTWKALPVKSRGLRNRITIIISTTMTGEELQQDNTTKEEVYLTTSLTDAFTTLKYQKRDIFICGGSKIYKEALNSLECKINYYIITEIDENYDCDNQFPYDKLLLYKMDITNQKKFLVMDLFRNKKVNITFTKYSNLAFNQGLVTNVNGEEQQYLNLLNEILQKGHYRATRNSNTWSLFGKTLEFNLSKGFPLLTTKKMFFKGIFEELLFFLNGDTNAKHLSELGVKIWDGNTTREFLDKTGLQHYEEFDLGPLYGYNFLHFGYPYEGMNSNYDGKGFNQIEYCLNLIKKDPYSRRILMTSFNPSTASAGVLYPCHSIVIQFYVEENNKLSAVCYNRSQDFFLGNPFNLSSTSLLIYLFCEVINNDPEYKGNKLSPGRMIMNLGDVHIYEDHYSCCIRQILREPFSFPTISFKRKITELTDFKFDDIVLLEYQYYPNIPAKMIA